MRQLLGLALLSTILVIGTNGYGYKMSRSLSTGDCQLQLSLPGTEPKDAYPGYKGSASSVSGQYGTGGLFGATHTRPTNNYGSPWQRPSTSTGNYGSTLGNAYGGSGSGSYTPTPAASPNYGGSPYTPSSLNNRAPYGGNNYNRRPTPNYGSVPSYGNDNYGSNSGSSNNRESSNYESASKYGSSSANRGSSLGTGSGSGLGSGSGSPYRPTSVNNPFGTPSLGGNRGVGSNNYGGSGSSSAAGDNYGNQFEEPDSIFEEEEKYVDRKFANEVVVGHNTYRQRHSTPPVRFDQEMSLKAQEWANELAQGRVPYGHSPDAQEGIYGENIETLNYPTASGRDVVDMWYKERKNYDYRDPLLIKSPRSLRNSHFTAMIWKATRKLGVGKARSRDGRTFVVVTYWPPGNIVDVLEDNVLPATKGTFY